MLSTLLTALLLTAGTGDVVANDDAPTVGASLDRTEAHVGDRLTLTVSAVARAGVAVTLGGKLELGKLEVLDRDDGDKNGRDLGNGKRSHRFVLGVAAYDVGELEVPPIEVTYIKPSGEARTVSTAAVPLTIKPLVAPDEANPDVQALRPTRSAMVEDKRLQRILRWGLVGVAGLLALAICGVLVRRAMRRVRAVELLAQPTGPVRPPDEIAMERLEALRAAGNYAVDLYRPFYFAVAEVVRAYLGARYHFDALELTTTELLNELSKKAPHLTVSDTEVVRFFNDTDLVKFAKTGSTDEAALAVLDAAQAIVLSTAAPLEQAAAQAAAQSGQVLLPRSSDDNSKKENLGG